VTKDQWTSEVASDSAVEALSCEHGVLLQAWCSDCDAQWQPGEVPAPRTGS
jgi:hypothetical protein